MRRRWLLVVCAALVTTASAAASPGFDGTYKAYLTVPSLRAVGTPPDLAAADAGMWTLMVKRGHWQLRQHGGAFGSSTDSGDVSVTAEDALFTTRIVDGYPHHVEIGLLRWHRDSSGLHFALTSRQREDLAGVLAAGRWRPAR